MRLKRAPVPAARNTGRNLAALCDRRRQSRLGVFVLRDIGGIRVDRRQRGSCMLSVNRILDLVQTLGAGFLPAVEDVPAEIAGARRNTLGMETGILVERNEVRRVRGAENMTAVTTVVST